MTNERKCQAEDQGGWPCEATPVVFQLTASEVKKNDGKQMYFCKNHRTNKFVWNENECEPIPPPFEVLTRETQPTFPKKPHGA